LAIFFKGDGNGGPGEKCPFVTHYFGGETRPRVNGVVEPISGGSGARVRNKWGENKFPAGGYKKGPRREYIRPVAPKKTNIGKNRGETAEETYPAQ